MAQRLTLPIVNCRITSGYKSATYKAQLGFTHYGTDMVSDDGVGAVLACGDGQIVAAGPDGANDRDRMGNCIVVVYRDVVLPDGRRTDLACRMFHFASLAVKAGDVVRRGQTIAVYGNTGRYSQGAHLHLEFDTDARYPRHAMGMAASGRVILKGSVDSTLAAGSVLYVGPGQKIGALPATLRNGWAQAKDVPVAAF